MVMRQAISNPASPAVHTRRGSPIRCGRLTWCPSCRSVTGHRSAKRHPLTCIAGLLSVAPRPALPSRTRPPTQLSAASIASPEQGMPASEAKADYPRHSSDFAGIDGILVGWVARVTGSCRRAAHPKRKGNSDDCSRSGASGRGIRHGIPVLVTIGGILLVIGVILWILGTTGRAVGGRKHYY